MYSGIRKNLLLENSKTRFYKTCRDRRTNNPPPVRYFSSQFTFLLLGDVSVCSEKMAAPGEKSFCVLEYHSSKSVVTVQRTFRAKYVKDQPTDNNIRAWYKEFTEIGCLCKQKTPMLTGVWQELEYRIDVRRVTRGAHIEHLQLSKTLSQFSCGCEQFH